MRLAALVVALIPATALAQPAMVQPQADLAPPGLTPSAQPQPDPIDVARDRDAAADRGIVLGTAIALPAGAVDVSLRAAGPAGMASVAIGLGSGFEISLDGGGVVVPGRTSPDAYGGSAKLVVVRRPQWALALDASLHRYADSSMPNVVGTGSAMATGCMGAGCYVLATAASGVAVTSKGDGNIAPFIAGSILLGRGWFRGIAEGAAIVGSGQAVGFTGARIGGKRFALDAGMGIYVPDSGSPMPLPTVGLSLRP